MNASPPSFLIVDGHNVIHAWPELLRLHRQGGGSAQQELRRLLAEYADRSDERVVLVFDGRGPSTTEERDPGGLQVFYSASGASADAVIERLAASYAATCSITVATGDRAEQDLVVAAGGVVISTEGLRDRLVRARRDLDDWLERHRRR